MRGTGLGPGFYVQQRCISRGWHGLCMSTRNYSLLGRITSHLWSGCVFLSCSGEVRGCTSLCVRGRGVYSYMPWERHPRRPACSRGWLYDPTPGSLTTSRWQIPGPQPTFKEALSAARRVWHRAAARRSTFPSTRAPDLRPERRSPYGKVYCRAWQAWYYISGLLI